MNTSKPGWKTTEFWVTVALALCQLGFAVAGLLPPDKAAVLLTVTGAAYKIARGLSKLGANELGVVVDVSGNHVALDLDALPTPKNVTSAAAP